MTSFYLAGKISKNGWRHEIVEGLRRGGVEYDEESYAYRKIPLPWGELKKSIFGMFDYTGPFFTDCDHGCTHVWTDNPPILNNSSGHTWTSVGAGNCANICAAPPEDQTSLCKVCGSKQVTQDGGQHGLLFCLNCNDQVETEFLTTDLARYVIRQCENGIQKADIFFAWIDSVDAYGTFVEIGMAHRRYKQIWIASPSFNPEMWFAYNLADKVEEHPTAKKALWSMTADLRKEEDEKNAIAAAEQKKQHARFEHGETPNV